MRLKNTPAPMNLVGAGGTNYRTKILPIGAWDMDAVPTVNVAHGIADITKIVHCSVLIRSDSGLALYRLDLTRTSVDALSGTIQFALNDVVLTRFPGEYFDSVDYDDVGINRGYIYIVEVL